MIDPARAAPARVAQLLDDNLLHVGDRFRLSLQRTLRVPEDGRIYPLPPGLGRLPIVPAGPGHFIVPLYQREALWLGFGGRSWKPNAVQIGLGGVNAISATPWDQPLSPWPQNYLVTPQQPWLDGINAGSGFVRQFVALPLADPRTIEAQVLGDAQRGGIQIRVFEPLPGRFPDEEPPSEPAPKVSRSMMGLGAGGKVSQRIHPDPFGIASWDFDSATTVTVHLVSSRQFEALTGRAPPPSPIDAATYSQRGFPWFELYDEAAGALPAAPGFNAVVPTGGVIGAESSVAIDPEQIEPIVPRQR